MANLVIVWVRDPKDYPKDTQSIHVFNEDTELAQLDGFTAMKRKEGCEVHESMVFGMSIEPLRKYLNDHPVI